jgi:hypothetical protein
MTLVPRLRNIRVVPEPSQFTIQLSIQRYRVKAIMDPQTVLPVNWEVCNGTSSDIARFKKQLMNEKALVHIGEEMHVCTFKRITHILSSATFMCNLQDIVILPKLGP